ncbi:hypothetical protein N7472_010574 [Penicillium cf. griseofulvum]|uniref:ubiquitinyl hydrolase 1 n=1 Tax=Penicillium cf. griseofulvum TaxID=2972120 RepID=A0A9W9IXB0_9EURO|nr:hypothetical protein N7472_010574 [Penicillium cf. griseofulvum]KAJ5436838.1 hypothetical protein N7445_007723 [Penicillium cf. griseofulvum]
MGEGKSSVIVPIVAAAIANESCLVRILVSKLGGLLGRRVYHMPVSRSLKLEQKDADEIEKMCRECMAQGGVLLIQPEHILSLKLMCLECVSVGKHAVGRSLLRTLQFFREYSRDVVDESDENFDVKFELIYTLETQTPVEFSPYRWFLIQEVLGVLREYVYSVMEEYPLSIEVDKQQSGGVPRIRLLRQDAKEVLFEGVATHICEKGIGSLPISRQPKEVRDAVLKYVLNQNLTPDRIAAVERNQGF